MFGLEYLYRYVFIWEDILNEGILDNIDRDKMRFQGGE